ncbi:hypothetical protein GALL_267790 [mine drainage metagenome]|uniref:Uncharacterized protein n=1 Tax=mine drainage metagenome TaxID=410659 RepID=A0A1J5R5P7_9ZZZZ
MQLDSLDSILEKTPLGRDELATNAHRLTPMVRGVLVLVNGQRRVADLLACASDRARWQEAISMLLGQGFVRPVEGSGVATQGVASSTRLPDTKAATSTQFPASLFASSELADAGEAGERDLCSLLCALATRGFGKQADKLVQKLRAADNTQAGQRAAVESCVKYIRLFIDEKKAEPFRRRAQDLIDDWPGTA